MVLLLERWYIFGVLLFYIMFFKYEMVLNYNNIIRDLVLFFNFLFYVLIFDNYKFLIFRGW